MNTEIRATKTGFTDIISLPEGIFNLFLGSETWGSANIQISGDGVHWFTLQKDNANLVISNNFAIEINGGAASMQLVRPGEVEIFGIDKQLTREIRQAVIEELQRLEIKRYMIARYRDGVRREIWREVK